MVLLTPQYDFFIEGLTNPNRNSRTLARGHGRRLPAVLSATSGRACGLDPTRVARDACARKAEWLRAFATLGEPSGSLRGHWVMAALRQTYVNMAHYPIRNCGLFMSNSIDHIGNHENRHTASVKPALAALSPRNRAWRSPAASQARSGGLHPDARPARNFWQWSHRPCLSTVKERLQAGARVLIESASRGAISFS